MRRTFDKLIDLIIRVTLLARDNISTPDMLGVSASEVARGKDSSKVSGSAVVAANSAVDFDNEETEDFLSPEAQTIPCAVVVSFPFFFSLSFRDINPKR